MVDLLEVTDHIRSLSEAEHVYGICEQANPEFFSEWTEFLPDLTTDEQERLDLIKRRYLYHRQHGHLLENAVNFLVISPLLEMTGLYDPPFLLRSEVSVRFEVEDAEETILSLWK